MSAHRYHAAMLWLCFVVSTALAVFAPDHVYTFLSGMSFGSALLATLICWKWWDLMPTPIFLTGMAIVAFWLACLVQLA